MTKFYLFLIQLNIALVKRKITEEYELLRKANTVHFT